MRLTAIIRREDALHVAWCPELDVASQGHSQDEALQNLKEAVELYLDDEDAETPRAAVLTSFEVQHDEAPGPARA